MTSSIILVLLVLVTPTTVLFASSMPSNCSLYANRSFLNEADMWAREPPLLLSFPGSGNSWTRMLIEFGTGILTGSVLHKDKTFWNVYDSERYCGKRQAAIKAHPGYVYLRKGNDSMYTNPFDVMLLVGAAKCKKGLMPSFRRVLLLVRDPFDAIVANYNLERSGLNHSGVVPESRFRDDDFASFFIRSSKGYNASLHNLIIPMIRQHKENSNADIHVAYYSDLVDSNKRYAAMEEILQFLKFPIDDKARTKCAFQLGDDSRIHRNYSQPRAASASFIYNKMTGYYGNITEDCIFFSHLYDFNTYFGFEAYPYKHLTEEHARYYRLCKPQKGQGKRMR